MIFDPEDFIARLTALVLKPRAHLTRRNGVLAPVSPDRARFVPGTRAAAGENGEPSATDRKRGPHLGETIQSLPSGHLPAGERVSAPPRSRFQKVECLTPAPLPRLRPSRRAGTAAIRPVAMPRAGEIRMLPVARALAAGVKLVDTRLR